MRELIIATRNAHKTAEFAAMLGGDWLVQDLTTRKDLPEPVEDGATFAENAAIKALAATQALTGLVLADDSGLEVDLLGGQPGIYSARYAGEKASDEANREKLLAELAKVDHVAEEPMAARFRCAIAIAEGGKILAQFDGTVEGRIILAEAGSSGFGYDPIFIPEGYDQTFGELDEETKNRISHRARALSQAREWLATQ